MRFYASLSYSIQSPYTWTKANHPTRRVQLRHCSLLSAVSRSEFLVAIAVLHQVLKVTYPLSQTLQTACHDLVSATSDIKAILGVVQTMRTDVVISFCIVWELAQQLAQSVDVTLSMPRIIGKGKQMYRGNSQCETAEAHYRTNLYIPFLDHGTSLLR